MAQQSLFDDQTESFRHDNHRRNPRVKARQQAGEGFKPLPEGVHAGVIIGLVDLGKQAGVGQIKDAYKVAVIVQFPGELTEKGEPMTVTKLYTSSMYSRSILRKDVEALFGKAFPSQEAADAFDFRALLGRAGLFNIQHKVSNEKVFANIVSIMPIPNGMEKPTVKPEHTLLFDLDMTGQAYADAFAKVPQWLQKKIQNRVIEQPEGGDLSGGDGGPADAPEDDDIPF